MNHSPEPWKVASNPGGPENQPLFPSVRDASELPHGEDIVAMPLGNSEIVNANAKRIVECVNACIGLAYPIIQIQNLKSLAGGWQMAEKLRKYVYHEENCPINNDDGDDFICNCGLDNLLLEDLDKNILTKLKVQLNNLEEEIKANINQIPQEFIVKCCEGGGPESFIGTLSISLARFRGEFEKLKEKLKKSQKLAGKFIGEYISDSIDFYEIMINDDVDPNCPELLELKENLDKIANLILKK